MKKALVLMLTLLAATARASMVSAYNDFGLRLLQELLREHPGQNVFISPASLAFALAMTANGAQGDTLQQMQRALGLSGEFNAENKALLDRLSHLDPKVTIEIANAIWVDNKAVIKPPFLGVNQKNFGATVANADFQNPATVSAINDWVSRSTRQKIRSIIEPPLSPADRLILLDAVYFKGDWASQFEKKLTQAEPFTTGAGEAISHPLMSKTQSMPYWENSDLQAVHLPYGSGAVQMTVILPREALSETIVALKSLPDDFQTRHGTLELPRFKLENSYQLIPALEALGIKDAFGSGANLSGISEEPLYINEVKQKTYVDVNEEGTEAAAVTSVGVRAMAVRREASAPFRMIVNHPFFVV